MSCNKKRTEKLPEQKIEPVFFMIMHVILFLFNVKSLILSKDCLYGNPPSSH
jgi:hypothetical protein